MPIRVRHVVVSVTAVLVASATIGACGGGGGDATTPNRAAYLTIVHSPVVGPLGTRDDASLLTLGQRACGDLDRGMRSDAVVADLGGDPMPGSADFNGYSMVTAAAARELCPRHRADFAGLPGSLTGSDPSSNLDPAG
jgi:hypothetical protein